MSITGKVKWFNEKKGFGFIVGERGEDVFVHHTAIVGEGFRNLKDGETVEYEFETTPKGLKATSVRSVGEQVPLVPSEQQAW